MNQGSSAVYGLVGPDHAAAERGGDRLMPQTNAQHRHAGVEPADQFQGAAGTVWRTRAGREHDRGRRGGFQLGKVDRRVADDARRVAQPLEISGRGCRRSCRSYRSRGSLSWPEHGRLPSSIHTVISEWLAATRRGRLRFLLAKPVTAASRWVRDVRYVDIDVSFEFDESSGQESSDIYTIYDLVAENLY